MTNEVMIFNPDSLEDMERKWKYLSCKKLELQYTAKGQPYIHIEDECNE